MLGSFLFALSSHNLGDLRLLDLPIWYYFPNLHLWLWCPFWTSHSYMQLPTIQFLISKSELWVSLQELLLYFSKLLFTQLLRTNVCHPWLFSSQLPHPMHQQIPLALPSKRNPNYIVTQDYKLYPPYITSIPFLQIAHQLEQSLCFAICIVIAQTKWFVSLVFSVGRLWVWQLSG